MQAQPSGQEKRYGGCGGTRCGRRPVFLQTSVKARRGHVWRNKDQRRGRGGTATVRHPNQSSLRESHVKDTLVGLRRRHLQWLKKVVLQTVNVSCCRGPMKRGRCDNAMVVVTSPGSFRPTAEGKHLGKGEEHIDPVANTKALNGWIWRSIGHAVWKRTECPCGSHHAHNRLKGNGECNFSRWRPRYEVRDPDRLWNWHERM